MVEIVLVSDIHGNAPALESVVKNEGESKTYAVLGDIMGLNSYPKRTLNLVREVGDIVLAGNHDKSIFEMKEGHVNSRELSKFELDHSLSSLSDDDIEYMLDLQHMEVHQHGDNRVVYTHAYPWPEKASGYESGNLGVLKSNVPSVASVVSNDYDYVFHGHTHNQYSLNNKKFGHDVHFVNPGCLGYENSYAVVDTESAEVHLKSVDYEEDIEDHIETVLPEYAPPVSSWY